MKLISVITLLVLCAFEVVGQCTIQLFVIPTPPATVAIEQVVGQFIQHAGSTTKFTNLVFLANGTTNWTSGSLPVGLHQFRCVAMNQIGTTSIPGDPIQMYVESTKSRVTVSFP